MTNRLRNSARPAITWFGGTAMSPSAFRVMDRTTKILVNAVVMSSSAGATDRAVIARITTIDPLGLPSTPLTSTETTGPSPVSGSAVGAPDGAEGSVGAVGAAGPAGVTWVASTTPVEGAAEAGAPPSRTAKAARAATARARSAVLARRE